MKPRRARLRDLIGTLGAVAMLFAGAPGVAVAATVGCGRVTTFVAPTSADAQKATGGDGWVIFAKPDGSSDKVILRAGTPVGTLSGYNCVTSEGVYFTGLLAPGSAGYLAEPPDWVTGTVVYCGTVAVNPFPSGQLSGPRTLQLPGGLNAFGQGVFRIPTTIPLPTVGTYICGRFEPGGPSMLVAVLAPGDPSYVVARTLPGTSTAPTDRTTVVLGTARTLLLAVGLLLFQVTRRRRACGAS